MSWSVSTGLVKKSGLQFAIQGLNLPEEQMNRDESLDQLNAAKMAALMLAMATPGPYVTVSLTGHANGVGWHKKEGMSNDFISINVYQQTEDDLKYFHKVQEFQTTMKDIDFTEGDSEPV